MILSINESICLTSYNFTSLITNYRPTIFICNDDAMPSCFSLSRFCENCSSLSVNQLLFRENFAKFLECSLIG